MKVKQVVTLTASSIWLSWRSLQIEDADGNEVAISLDDSQIDSLAERFTSRSKENKIKQLEKLREELEELEEEVGKS